MDAATEAVNLRRQLEKAVSSEDVERMGDVLNSLGSVEVTLPVLRESKVGATVSKLKKHANMGVSNSAKALVKKWKRVAEASGVQGGAAAAAAAAAGGAVAGASAAGKMGKPAPGSAGKRPASPSGLQGGRVSGGGASAGGHSSAAKAATSTALNGGGLKAASASSSSSAAPLSRQSSTSSTSELSHTLEVDHVLAEDGLAPLRLKMRQKLFDALVLGAPEDERLPAAHAAGDTERAMERNNPLVSRKTNYLDKARQLVFNLKKNDQLRQDMREGLVAAERLVVMTSTELMSKEKREEMDKAVSDRTEARMLDWYDKNQDKINKQCGIKETEGMFECGRCKSTKTTYTQKQTRSADEPMTTFVTCSNCKNRWKFC